MSADRIFTPKPGDDACHDGQRIKTQRRIWNRAFAERPRHQTAIAPVRMGSAKPAHVVMGGVGVLHKAHGQSDPRLRRLGCKAPCPGQKIIDHAAPHHA